MTTLSHKGRQFGVLIIVENLPVPFDRRVWQEATALHQAGYRVSVICPKGQGYDLSYEMIDGIHIYRHPLPLEASGVLGYLIEYPAALFFQFLLSVRILRKHGFDVIQACNPPDLIFLVAKFHKLLFGKRFIFDQHDLNPELFEAKFGRRGFLHRLVLLFERWTFRTADASLATNEMFREIALDRGGMPPDRVWVVKSYPDLGRFKRTQPRTDISAKYRYLVGYLGVIGSQDGVDILMHAMAHIVHHEQRSNVHCLVIGDGPALAQARALSRDLAIDDHVTFTGFLSGESLMAHLSALDVGVIPDPSNAFNDKLSMNKVFEYMALGLPFVQFDLAQARSESGEAGLVVKDNSPVNLAAGIMTLLADEDRRARMSAYGVERAQREFQWDHAKEELLSAYQAVLQQ